MTTARLAEARRRGGIPLAARLILTELHDRIQEARLGIESRGLIAIETLIADWEGFHDYYPTSFRGFARLMREVPLQPSSDVFVDFGSGKGRVLIMAARYPFRRVIGVEIAGALNTVARQNIARTDPHRLCQDISIWDGNASDFTIPEDATVFYFYNPFHEPLLGTVLRNIARSLLFMPRRAWIVFNNTRHMKAIESQHPWFVPVVRLSLEHECAVYHATD